jgi:outer membrane lipoprotein-sorting protein
MQINKPMATANSTSNRLLAAIFLGLLGAGCPKRIDFGSTGEIKDVGVLLKLTDEAESKVRSIKGEARSRVNSPRSKGAVNLFVAASRPTLVHLEFLNFFGKPQAVLVSDGKSFGLFNSDEGKYYRGPASPTNLSRILPVPMPVQELAALMLGLAPRISAEPVSLSIDAEARTYLVTLARGPVVQRLWIDPSSYRVLRSELTGERAYLAVFEDFTDAGGATYPRKIILDAPNPAAHLELRYRDAEVNSKLDPSLFKLEPPPGVPVVELDEDGRESTSAPPRAEACTR